MNSIAANGISLNVQRLAASARTASQAQPATVVCVHGLVLDNLSSYYFTLAKPLVLAGANVVMYDLRGYGRSSAPAHGYQLRDHVADLVGLLDSLALTQPVHLIGNSFGGTIALATAATHPQRVASIVAIEAFPPTGAVGCPGGRHARPWSRATAGPRCTGPRCHEPDGADQQARRAKGSPGHARGVAEHVIGGGNRCRTVAGSG